MILSDASPSLEEKARTKKPTVKASSKPTRVKSNKGKRTKAKTLEKGKAKEPLQEEIPNPQSTNEDLLHEVGYDESETLIPSFLDCSKRRRRLFLLASSISEDEAYSLGEQEEVRSPSHDIAKERFTFHGKPQVHRPITRTKNKLRLNYKLRDNPRLRDLIINIDDSPTKEQPPKSKKKRVAKPEKVPKAKVDKEKGLKLLVQVLDTLS